ncbi:MAG: hypothetical protein LBF17_04290 [Mediterranea sp.]|jgi:hypothetical protein|nr:hypothetical protein [Mediterranea sp.]
MRKIYLILLFSLSLMSCSKQVEQISLVELSPIEKKDMYEKQIRMTESCYSDCFILDSMLILIANCDTNYFHVYNKQSLQLIKKFGIEGEAPHDFLRPIPYNTNYLENNGIRNFHDIRTGYNKEVNFNKIISGHNLADCILAKPVDQALLPCHEINFVNENKIIMRSVDEGDGLFMSYDPKTGKKNWVDFYPEIDVEDKLKRYVYYGLVHANPQKNAVAFFYRYFDGVLFFDLNGKMKRNYFFSEIRKPAMSNKYVGVSNESTLYSVRVCSTPNYCFVMRVNQPFKSIQEDPKPPVHILKFNWEGELLHVYEFSIFPYLFTVDEETETIYILNQSREAENPYVEILAYPIAS